VVFGMALFGAAGKDAGTALGAGLAVMIFAGLVTVINMGAAAVLFCWHMKNLVQSIDNLDHKLGRDTSRAMPLWIMLSLADAGLTVLAVLVMLIMGVALFSGRGDRSGQNPTPSNPFPSNPLPTNPIGGNDN